MQKPTSSTLSWFAWSMTAVVFGFTISEVILIVFYPSNKYIIGLVNASLLVIGIVLVVEGAARALKWK